MWTRASLLVLLGACYAPTLTTGAPCDPVIDNCPSGQTCDLRGAEYRCGGPGEAITDGPAGSDTVLIDAAGDAPSDSATDGSVDAPAVTHVEYMAMVADCVNPALPNPDTCKSINGAAQLAIDANDSATANPWIGFLRFDLDGVLAGRIVTSLKLRLVATTDSKAKATNTGQIWRVNPFSRLDLFAAPVPARIGGAPLAPSQGNVDQLDVIEWTLPVTLATANGSVYLELETPSSDGTNYWNLSGPNPPRLLVDLQ